MFLEVRGGVCAQPLPCPGQVQHLFLGSAEYIVLCIYISQAEAQLAGHGDFRVHETESQG